MGRPKSVFANAEVIEIKTKSKTKEKEEVLMPQPFDTLINLLLVEKHIEAAVSNLKKDFTSNAGFDVFYQKMIESKEQPESFIGICENTQAQFQYTNAGFNKAVAEKLDTHGIKYVVESKIEERYFFNPEALKDTALMKKIDLALQKLQQECDMQIIQKQESVDKFKFDDNTIAQIVEKVEDPAEQAELLKEIAVMKIAYPKVEGKTHEDGEVVAQALKHLVTCDIIQLAGEKKAKGKKVA
jgi:hypothetical protein